MDEGLLRSIQQSQQLISYQQVCKKFNKTHNQTQQPREFYLTNVFIQTMTKAFCFKNKKIVKNMLHKWNNKIQNEVAWAEEAKIVTKREIFLIKRLHLREMIKITNMSRITKNVFKMTPEEGLAFCLGVVHATFIFENTGMYLTIEEIYNIIPSKQRSETNLKKFKKDFIMKGTSPEINKILYSDDN